MDISNIYFKNEGFEIFKYFMSEIDTHVLKIVISI